MTDQEINVAIADMVCESKVVVGVIVYRLRGTTGIWDAERPDFCHDLNAMHEAEKVLQEPDKYLCCLLSVGCLRTWHATARQRAEAFLRTLGKWEEGK